jgi:hypothetical protein
MKLHYPGRKRGDPKRVRMALIGALRTGQVDCRCQRWREQYWADSGASYDSGWSDDSPRDGWLADFWQASLASDYVCWKSNRFTTSGIVSIYSAPLKVRRWLAQNDEAYADWQRTTDEVAMNWADVHELLSGTGWQSWEQLPKAKRGSRKGKGLATHYRHALIGMIAATARDPNVLSTRRRIHEALFNEFEFGGMTPDIGELRGLVREIWEACLPVDEPLPPD